MENIKSKIKIPHTLALISSIVIIVAALTWIVPSGEYNRVKNADGRTLVEAGSYHEVESNPQGAIDVLLAPFEGLERAMEIVIFILIIGGAFGIILKTGAVDAAIVKAANALLGKEIIVIPVMMILFSIGGATFGMSEETIPFIAIFVPFALALGYDSIVGLAIPFVGAGLGFAGAMFNPFTVGIAQGIAELPPFSGVGYRTFCWAVITTVGIIFVMLYARKIKRDPTKSLTYEMDQKKRTELPDLKARDTHMSTSQKMVIITFLLGMALLVVGVLKWGWYIKEICALFMAIGFLCGIAAKMGPSKISDCFIDGARDLCGAAVIVGFARAILVIAEDGKIIDTVLHKLAGIVEGVPHIVSTWIMFLVQTVINFFVPSGSGQAAITIPVMAPLSDLIGIKRQVAVLAYQFGDGFTNLIIPTSVVLLGCLMVAKVPWSKWARWILPLQLVFIVLGCALLSGAILIGFGT